MKKLLQFCNTSLLKWATLFTLAFIALYPKLPSIYITHTWVYVRLEDFLISFIILLWIFQLIRKKITLPFPLGLSIVTYWVIGLASLLVSVTIFGPHIPNFFPKVAALEYFRRIEYMLLFFVAFSTIKSVKDVKDYIVGLTITVTSFVIYGLGQHFYLYFWQAFPKFFEKLTFCFPSFQTGNEEFAKGIPLCLPENARITSTFGGHYDLAAYLVVVLPVIFVFMLTMKKKLAKVAMSILFVFATMVLIFTASRISFVAYLIGISGTLIFIKRKKFIVPIWIVSLLLLVLFSGSLAKRFLQTIRVTSVVTNNQGQVVGVAESSLPQDLKNKISKNDAVVQANQPVPNGDIPAGTAFNLLPQNTAPVATNVAVVKNSLTPQEAQKLRFDNGGLQISTVSGSFLIQKALVYDISFTTRFQGEWPHAWAAFMTFPPLGTGFSSITLATDNDYLRALGESGFLGLLSFLAIFFVLGIYLKESGNEKESSLPRLLGFALAGGIIGLLINASLIDVFESSKVAESLWILLGVAAGGIALTQKKHVDYWKYFKALLTSNISIALYLFVTTFAVLGNSLNNFFVGDDFTWLKWAATSTTTDVLHYFTDAGGFFYRPIAKLAIFVFYTFFSFQPQGYRFFTLLMHFLIGFGIFLLAKRIFKNKFWAAASAVLFLVLQANAEDVFWIATISTNISTLFAIYGILAFLAYRDRKNILYYVISVLLSVLVMFSYEMGVIFPLVIILADVLLVQPKQLKKAAMSYIAYVVVLAVYAVMRLHAHGLGQGGDYSYSIPHLIPNVVGNFLGYSAFLLFGEKALPVYTALRTALRVFALPIALVLVVAAVVFGVREKTTLLHLKLSETGRMYAFALLFMVIALLPFLGLGNLSPRYGYFASIGFVLLIALVVRQLTEKFVKDTSVKYTIASVVMVILAGWNIAGMQASMQEWAAAGNITLNTLKTFRVYYENVPKGAHVYVANMPIRIANAWVFPVGFNDALWFIYRDDTMHIDKVSVDQAKVTAAVHSPNTYVFQFDSKGNINELK